MRHADDASRRPRRRPSRCLLLCWPAVRRRRRHGRARQRRMLDVEYGGIVGHDDHARADSGHAPQLHGEVMRQADAAVRGRIARHDAGVQRHPRPGDALHVGHRRVGVDVGAVEAVLLDHGEHAGGRTVSRHPGGYRALGYEAGAAVDPDALLGERHHCQDWAGRRPSPVFFAGCGSIRIRCAPPPAGTPSSDNPQRRCDDGNQPPVGRRTKPLRGRQL